jgi:hypothetical protein
MRRFADRFVILAAQLAVAAFAIAPDGLKW